MSKKKILIIGFVWPEPTSTAAGNRMLQLIHFFLFKQYEITFTCIAAESDLSIDFDVLGIEKKTIALNDSSFDVFVAQLQPEIVVFDRFLTEEQFGWRIAKNAPNALRILDTEDLHSLRHTRAQCFKKGSSFSPDKWLKADITKREIASIYRSDISLIISTYEMSLLKDSLQINESILFYLPFMLDTITSDEINSWKAFEERTDFICIGNGKHAPNIDAVIWLKTVIWPIIRKKIPEAKLKIYGAYLPQQLQQMHKPSEGFFLEGWVENVNGIFANARVNLAPLRFGAGLKGKLISAMQNGIPSVTTKIGVEGITGDREFNGIIAETAENIAQGAIELYSKKNTWLKAQVKGYVIINSRFNKTHWIDALDIKINSTLKNLDAHRSKNFVGALLQHQTMASTKYMSKWIEEKNK